MLAHGGDFLAISEGRGGKRRSSIVGRIFSQCQHLEGNTPLLRSHYGDFLEYNEGAFNQKKPSFRETLVGVSGGFKRC